jgi:hypothetical protein
MVQWVSRMQVSVNVGAEMGGRRLTLSCWQRYVHASRLSVDGLRQLQAVGMSPTLCSFTVPIRSSCLSWMDMQRGLRGSLACI